MDKRNLEMIADFYEFTMANGYFKKNMNEIAYFDVFFRSNPFEGGYAIMGGLDELISYIENFKFTKEDIKYLSISFQSSFSDAPSPVRLIICATALLT